MIKIFEVALERNEPDGSSSVVSMGEFSLSQVINWFDKGGRYGLASKLDGMRLFDYDKQNHLEIKRRNAHDTMCIYRVK